MFARFGLAGLEQYRCGIDIRQQIVDFWIAANALLTLFLQFLVEQKNSMRHSGEGIIQVLQNQLYMAEQEAADAVARCIAENPPALLQAVITPHNVGGWSGQHKKRPEGGGAPCPPEFLLNREKRRTGDANGPSRVHPSEQQKQAQSQQPSQQEESNGENATGAVNGKDVGSRSTTTTIE